MAEGEKYYAGGCLCGQIRYEARGEPRYQGLCYCSDCQKASGSGFIPFLGFGAEQVEITGTTLQFTTRSARGTEAVRNSCPFCGSLVFGGRVGEDDQHTIYAGTLDDSAAFTPQIAVFTRDRRPWTPVPDGLPAFDTLPSN